MRPLPRRPTGDESNMNALIVVLAILLAFGMVVSAVFDAP